MKVKEIVEATNGKLLSGDEELDFIGFDQDSRRVKEGYMYIPLKGERFDGHSFIDGAFKNGASAIITAKEVNYPDKAVILVDDTLKALQDMGHYLRHHRNVKVIGITGSVGKTSTRDMVYSVVATKYKALKTEGNYNNHIGLPLTILRYQDEEVMVLEMGMNHLGEMHVLSMIGNPDVAAITNVGTAHIGELGSRENILKAKMEITDGMEDGATLIINDDNDMLHTVKEDRLHIVRVSTDKVKDIVLHENDSEFTYIDDGKEYRIHVPVAGEHFITNALIAIAIGKEIGIEMELCKQGIESFQLTKNRNDIINLKNHITIIDGSYNASLDSMKSSLDVLKNYTRRKICVLGDMLELGEFSKDLHKQVGEYAAKCHIDEMVFVGNEAQYMVDGARSLTNNHITYCKTNEEVLNYLLEELKADDVVLFKASNGMKLKEIINGIKEKYND